MTATSTHPGGQRRREELTATGRTDRGDLAFRLLALGAGLLVLAVLAMIAVSTTRWKSIGDSPGA